MKHVGIRIFSDSVQQPTYVPATWKFVCYIAILEGRYLVGTVKWGKSEHLKFFQVVLKLLSIAFSPFFLQKSWYQKFYFLFQDLTDSVVEP
jgi:hypothetical protein